MSTEQEREQWRELAEKASRQPRGQWDNELIAAQEQFSEQALEIVTALLADVDRLTKENARLRYDYDQDINAARKYSAEDRVFAADELAQVKRERDALAAELARFEEIERYYQDRNNVIAETGSKRNNWQQP